MTETTVVRSFSLLMKAADSLVWKIHGHAMQKSGIPDLYIANKIWSGWLEVKIDDNQLSRLQFHTIRRLRVLGIPAFVLRWYNKGMIGAIQNHLGITHANFTLMVGTGLDILYTLRKHSEKLNSGVNNGNAIT